MRPGRVYAYSAEDLRLLISEDEGATWREFILERQPSFLATHPADPDYIYLGNLTIRDERNTRPGFLLHSADGGRT